MSREPSKTILRESAPSDPEPLRVYTKTKLALAAQLRVLCEALKQGGDETRLKQGEELMAKLAEDRFTLAVVGQFKRGKSSLMNAIIGRELLPVGVLPLTSAITIVRYGPKERLLIRRSDVSLPFSQEEPVERLTEFVTEKGNPGNCKRVKTATIEVPLPFLRRGLEFVDTPGIGSAIEANTATTLKFLPECDAALFVTSGESPFTSIELEFLENIRQHVHKIFFVVNKMDLLGAKERQEVLDFVRDTIHRQTGADNVRFFPISSRRGLAAKQLDDWMGGLESGLNEFEGALARFLSSEKAAVFLNAVIERALELCGREPTEAALVEIRRRLLALREKISPVTSPAQVATDESAATPISSTPLSLAKLPATEPPKPDPTNDFKTRSCPACVHLSKVAFHFFTQFQYDLVYDETAQKTFAKTLGFCPLHLWQLEAVSSPVGASIGFTKLAEHVSKILVARAKSPRNGRDKVKLIRDTVECRVCRLLRETERDYLGRLGEYIERPKGRAAYAASQGVCLRHLELWLHLIADDEMGQFLLKEASRHFEQMAEDMQSFSLKTEASRRWLRNQDEEDAYWRTVTHLAGTKNNCVPMSKEVEI
ncbi:MAG TPA: dynamin family protein [Candidatus Aquilonibacter sp.]|nr:dynamin family protein [Candidatus Aquilonibacter sp.]